MIFSLKEKFAYMAHMSGYDKIYGGDGTDLLNHIMKRIDEFDAVRNEKRLIKVYIVSPNVNYDKNIIDALLRWGLMLSQINIIVNPQAKYADISHDYTTQKTLINWNVQMKKVKYGMYMDDVHSLAEYYYRTRASN
ncbi:MAG: hypothetical protein C0603_11480 [Denitrovibrio sp.]|nr:MAG: hypothetical protein C0603_11480 [Denitrovibrio sp.]